MTEPHARNTSLTAAPRDETELLLHLLEETASKTGQEFFRALVRNLAQALGTSGAWVTDYLPQSRRLRARAFWLRDRWVDHYEYAIDGTPCAPVIAQCRLFHVPERVIELFPDDPGLRALGAVSYTGMPFTDGDGRVIGHLAVLDVKPMPETPRYLTILRLFGARAAAELRRVRAEARLREREQRLARLIAGAMDGIIDFDEALRVHLINPAAAGTFQVDPKAELCLADLLDADSLAEVQRIVGAFADAPEPARRLWLPHRLRGRRADGRTFDLEATLSQGAAGGRSFYTLIFRDVQARLEAEARIARLTAENTYLREELDAHDAAREIVGRSPALQEALRAIRQVADTDATVLLLGESGTGKELFARALHRLSRRRNGPLIKVNCAAIPADLVESEFFGHEKGAFTGATAKRPGRFALADGGTLFLDEIGELPLALQAKLLRVLQEGEFEPVGASQTRTVDVRVVAATNRDLGEAVRAGTFRADLYYRLNVFPVRIPPLRERAGDIELLAETFCRHFAHKLGRVLEPLGEDDRRRLRAYPWPGNVRELQNVIERAVITATGGRLNLAAILAPAEAPRMPAPEETAAPEILTDAEIRRLERDNIRRALDACGWKVVGENGAARRLGLSPSTLASRMKAFGLTRSGR